MIPITTSPSSLAIAGLLVIDDEPLFISCRLFDASPSSSLKNENFLSYE